jgi:hypothetical protein
MTASKVMYNHNGILKIVEPTWRDDNGTLVQTGESATYYRNNSLKKTMAHWTNWENNNQYVSIFDENGNIIFDASNIEDSASYGNNYEGYTDIQTIIDIMVNNHLNR